MKIKSCVTAAVCALALALSVTNVCYARASAETTAAEQAEYTQDMEVLQGLGFLDIETLSPTDSVTRGEAASVLANILEPNRKGVNTQTEFVDVLPEYWASEAAAIVTQSGWMGRSADGKFYPSAPLTDTELLCILVRMTGYAQEAECGGGYPQGYLYAANLAGMNKLRVSDNAVSCADFCSRLLKALDTPLMLTEYGQKESYFISDQSYFEQHLSMYRDTGRVTATENRHFYGDSTVREQYILIDSVEYAVREDIDTDAYFGCRVEFYYIDRDDEERLIVYLRKPEGKNKTLTVTSDDIVSVQNNQIEYYQNDKVRKAAFSAQTDILCNGQAMATLPDLERFDYTVIQMIASDSGNYDYINIMGYETYVVQSYQPETFTLYGKYNANPLILNSEETDVILKDSMDNRLELSVLKAGDVLSVAQSEDGEHISMLYSALCVSGKVDTISDEKVKVNGEEYKLCGNAKSRIEGLSLGAEYHFYLDGFGKIVDWKAESNTNRKFAYLTKIGGDEWSGISVRLFETTGQFDTKKLASKVKIDGADIRTDKDIETVKQALMKENTLDQLIVYSLNGDGEINYIDTSKKGMEENENTLTNIFNNFSNRIGSSSTRLKYSTATRIFSGKVIIDENVKVFFVPIDAATADESFFEVRTISRYQQDRQYSLDCYKVNQDSFVSEVNVEYISTKRELDSTSPGIFLVNEIAQTVNAAGESVTKLSGFGPRGAAVSVNLDSEVNIQEVKHAATEDRSAIAVGDVIRYKTNPLGDVIHMELYFDASERKLLTASNPSTGTATGIAYSDQHRFIWGNVFNRLGGTAMIVRDDLPLPNDDINSASWWEYQVLDKSAVFLFDEKGKTPQFRRITPEEVLDYVHTGANYVQVLAYTYWGDANTVIVYEREGAAQ